ncbi:MAG: IdeS/Mac family cysteine endopeptidase [Eubacteriales bacterium]|nr:IdeS/Mac family cysteine endopeptidase [Eubacteriales bacterium]
MKKIPFVLTVFFVILFNIYAVSAQTAVLQESRVTPTITATTQRYSNYSTATVKLYSMPESCYIIIAEYISNRCVDVEVREYQTATEQFNIPDEVDTIKVMVWDDHIKPVVKAKTIDMKASAELDKKIDKIARNLKTSKNPNVTTYKTEENQPRAIIWTKGIIPPQLSEFEKEVEITNSNYTFLYAGQDKGSGWYDVNKSLPQEDGADRNMCYAAVSANQLHWWLDQNKDNIDMYLNKLATGEIIPEYPLKLDRLEDLRSSYKGQAKSGIYNMFRDYFEHPIDAYNADLLNDFFINGYQANTAGKVNSPDFFKWDPRGGFFYDVFEKKKLTLRYGAGDYTVFKRDIPWYMQDGQSIGLIHSTPTNGVTHIITLWGVEFDHNNEITALFVTDSDDYEQPEIAMKRMLLKKNSSGYPVITTNIIGNTGAQILEFVPLSLGEECWNELLCN